MIGVVIPVRSPGDVNVAIDERQTGTLIFPQRVEGNGTTTFAVSRDADRAVNFDRAVGSLGSIRQTQCMQPLVTVPSLVVLVLVIR